MTSDSGVQLYFIRKDDLFRAMELQPDLHEKLWRVCGVSCLWHRAPARTENERAFVRGATGLTHWPPRRYGLPLQRSLSCLSTIHGHPSGSSFTAKTECCTRLNALQYGISTTVWPMR